MQDDSQGTNIARGMLLLVVGFSWILLYLLFQFETTMLFAPWDSAITLPESGTWQRTLNDFIDLHGGASLIAFGLVGASIWRVLRCVRRTSGRLFQVLIVNLLLFFGMPVLLVAVSVFQYSVLFPYPDVPYDPTYRGYHLSVLPLLISSVMLWAWYRAQDRIMSDQRKAKRKRAFTESATHAAIQRLSEPSTEQTIPPSTASEKQQRVIT